MKSVKQVVAAVVWCAVSVGCVAEEPKQSATPVEAVSADQSSPEDDDSKMSNAVRSDIEEIFNEKIISIVKRCHQNKKSRCFYIINEKIAVYLSLGNRDIEEKGKITFPKDRDYSVLANLIGKNASIFCKKYDFGYSFSGANYQYCSIGEKKYYLNFE